MRLKNDSIKIQGIRQELLFALMIADKVYSNYGQELIITSLNDSKHALTSLHYSGCAADLRVSYFKSENRKLVQKEIKERLNIDYDVVLEKDHIHLEYQPRFRI